MCDSKIVLKLICILNLFDRWVCIMWESLRIMENSLIFVCKGNFFGFDWERTKWLKDGILACKVREYF